MDYVFSDVLWSPRIATLSSSSPSHLISRLEVNKEGSGGLLAWLGRLSVWLTCPTDGQTNSLDSSCHYQEDSFSSLLFQPTVSSFSTEARQMESSAFVSTGHSLLYVARASKIQDGLLELGEKKVSSCYYYKMAGGQQSWLGHRTGQA